MAQTTLPVRLVQQPQATTRQTAAFRNILLGILLLAGSMVTGCGSAGDGLTLSGNDGSAPSGAAPSGTPPSGAASAASAALAWDPVGGVVGYYIHYGTESPNSPGSCTYAQSTFSSTPTATVTGLAANTTYYFAVSSFNGIESTCSSEVSTVTTSV
jgi:hypothetical protein